MTIRDYDFVKVELYLKWGMLFYYRPKEDEWKCEALV